MPEFLFDDVFIVTRLDPDGKKFDRVSRVEAKSEIPGMYMQLDVATEVYPMRLGEKFKMVLAETLNLDGSADTGYYTHAVKETLADKYDYVMQGKLYKIADYVPPPPPEKKDADSDKDAENSSNKDADTSKNDEDTSSKNDEDASKNDEDASSKASKEDPKVEIFASFGGLLMLLRGDPSFATPFGLDKRIFLLIRKV
ncbi:unnamed protein product [Urochloa decumbens]|uniref:Uncharacterized protein n=1 Tax=Urochloa decumbens TaxID=240449 RepID=A0ABC9GVI4_9POAL